MKTLEKTLVNFILDKSGSMGRVKSQTISGFNEYVDTLKPYGNAVRMTFTKFSGDGTDIVFNNKRIQDVEYLNENTYTPGGLTPLYDAIGRSIKAIERELQGTGEKVRVLCVVMTDGEENNSKEYKRSQIFDMIKDKEKEDWSFVYLGANQDVWLEGGKVGYNMGNIQLFKSDSVGTTRGLATLCAATASYMDSGVSLTSDYFAMASDDDIDKYAAKIAARDTIDFGKPAGWKNRKGKKSK